MSTAEAKKSLRTYRKEHGLCKECGEPALEGYVRCETCLKIRRIKRHEYNQRSKDVLKRAREARNQREDVRHKNRDAQHKLYVYRRENGLCVYCGEYAEGGKSYCLKCRQIMSVKQKIAYHNSSDEKKRANYERQQEWRKNHPKNVEAYKKKKREYNYG